MAVPRPREIIDSENELSELIKQPPCIRPLPTARSIRLVYDNRIAIVTPRRSFYIEERKVILIRRRR